MLSSLKEPLPKPICSLVLTPAGQGNPTFATNAVLAEPPRGVMSHSRLERNSAILRSARLTPALRSPSDRTRTRAVGAISEFVPENPDNPGLAERGGFEPPKPFRVYTLSRRAP